MREDAVIVAKGEEYFEVVAGDVESEIVTVDDGGQFVDRTREELAAAGFETKLCWRVEEASGEVVYLHKRGNRATWYTRSGLIHSDISEAVAQRKWR